VRRSRCSLHGYVSLSTRSGSPLGWGFATLLLNPLALVYAVMRPQKCKYPLILFGIALVFLLVGLSYAKSKDRAIDKRAHFEALHPTHYSGLRQPPRAGELKR
jgi:hypothetical protein